MTDAELAAHLAACAGRILIEVRDSGMFDGKALGKAGDQTANQFLVLALRQQRPDDGLLSEGSKDTAERLDTSRGWLVDPVDGPQTITVFNAHEPGAIGRAVRGEKLGTVIE